MLITVLYRHLISEAYFKINFLPRIIAHECFIIYRNDNYCKHSPKQRITQLQLLDNILKQSWKRHLTNGLSKLPIERPLCFRVRTPLSIILNNDAIQDNLVSKLCNMNALSFSSLLSALITYATCGDVIVITSCEKIELNAVKNSDASWTWRSYNKLTAWSLVSRNCQAPVLCFKISSNYINQSIIWACRLITIIDMYINSILANM